MSVAVTRTTQKRIRWKAGKEDELWNYVQSRIAAGVSISESLKTFADRNGISWLTARWKYYRLKQEREAEIEIADDLTPVNKAAQLTPLRQAEEHSPEMRQSEALRPEEAYKALTEFLSSASRIENLDLASLLLGLSSMAKAALSGEEAMREADAVRRQYNELQQRFAETKRLMEHVRTEYDALLRTACDWLELHSVDRVTMMGEFAKKLQTEVEKVNRAIALAEGF